MVITSQLAVCGPQWPLQELQSDEWVTTRRHHDDVTWTRKQEVTTGAGRGKSLFWLSGTKAVLLNCDSFDRTGIGERICIWSNQFFLSYYCTGHVCYNVVNKCYNIRSWSMSWNAKCLMWVSLIRTVCRVYQRCRVLDIMTLVKEDTHNGQHFGSVIPISFKIYIPWSFLTHRQSFLYSHKIIEQTQWGVLYLISKLMCLCWVCNEAELRQLWRFIKQTVNVKHQPQ